MAKYLLIALVVVLVLWVARGGRRRAEPPPARPGPDATPQDMVACAHCGVHLPRSEALPGRGGSFCGEAHRIAYEQTHAGS